MPARSRSFIATLFGRSAGPHRRRPARSRRRPIGAEQLESRAMLAGVDVNGGLSWDGWTNRGLSNQGGLYGSGGTTGRDTYEVYTTTFAFAGDAIEKNPVQAVAPAPDGFASGRFAPIPGGREIRVSDGAFQAGNTILGIGVRATTSDGSIAGFWPTIRFDLDNDSYQPASFEVDSDGRTTTLNNDGRTSFTTYAEPGDFTVQFEGSASWRGSSISVREAATAQLLPATVRLSGGVGSGTSYDFAFRAFAQPAAKSYQMFLDMTAIPKLYGSVYRTFFPARSGVGAIGDRVTVSLNGLGSNNVVFDANLGVDLDVDSDNANTIPDQANDSLDRSAAEEAIEEDLTRPGVIVPVGGSRAKMVVDVPHGRTATLAFDAAAAAKVKVFEASGAVALDRDRLSTPVIGGSPQTFWIEAFAPSATMADIAFTLTTTGGSPASSDRIHATAMAASLDLAITGLAADEEDTIGGLLAVNNNRDEDNYNSDGTPVRDNEADATRHQWIIGPDDKDLLPATVQLWTGPVSAAGAWSLSFPNTIRVWRRDGDAFLAVESGLPIRDMASDGGHQPQLTGTSTIDLLIEGMQHSTRPRDILLAGSLTLDPTPGQTFQDDVSLTAPKLERVAWDPTSGEVFDASDKIPASDFRPEVSLSVTQARLDSAGNLIVDLSVTVADELSGLLDSDALRINGLTLYANNVPVAQISGLAASHLIAGAVPWQPHGFRGVTHATVLLPPPAVTGTWGGATCVLRAQTTANAAGHEGWDQATVVIGWRPESEWSPGMGNPDRAGSIQFSGDGQPSQAFIPIVELIQAGVGSTPGAAYPWMMRVTALDDELAARVAVSIDNVPQELAPFTFSPRQHYVIKPGRPGPKLFVLTSDELTTEALQAITPGQIQPAHHGDAHAFRVIGPQGQPLANVKVSAAVHEERLLHDEVGGINLPSPTVNDLGNLLRLFQILYGDEGLKALDLFDRSGGHLEVRQFALGWPLSNGMSYGTRSDGALEILVAPDVDVMQAAQFLAISLERALGTYDVGRLLSSDDLDTFRKAYEQKWRNGFAAVATGAELYINGIGVVFEPVDVVITVNELSQGNLHAVIGFIPFISANFLKQGAKIVVKNGDNVIVSMSKQVADAIGTALKKTNFRDQLRYLVANTSVADRKVLLDAKILISARKRINQQQFLRGLEDRTLDLDPDFIAEQIEAFNTFTKRELHHDLPFEFKDWFLVRGVDVNEVHTLRFVEGSLKENTEAFKAQWRYHQSWDGRAGGFHSQWDSWMTLNPEATREEILAKMMELRGAFPARGIPDTP